MKKFYLGFLSGVVFKDKVCELFKNVLIGGIGLFHHFHKKEIVRKNSLISKVYLVCKITDNTIFDEWFPKLKVKSRVQPRWEFYEKKNVIRIELDMDTILIDDTINYTALSDIDIELFEEFSEPYIFIYYNLDKEYINVYPVKKIIPRDDLKMCQTKNSEKYKEVVCATIYSLEKTIYITKYFKMFLNNAFDITPELMLLNFPKDIALNENVNLQVVNIDNINNISMNEII
jgi:hypothetical protein